MESSWNEGGNYAEELYPSLFPPTTPFPPPASESRVLILNTGGTICMQPSPEGLVTSPDFLRTHLSPRPSFNSPAGTPLPALLSYKADGTPVETPALRTPPSRYGRRILYTVQELFPLLDSSSVSAPAWSQLARLLRANYSLYDAFVILHGTDSLAYTAAALSFMLRNLAKPVILTGSQAPMAELGSDATDNLLGALVLAGHFLIPEVGLFFRQKLFRGNRSTKVSADAYEAFASPNLGPLAEVRATGVRVYWSRVRKINRSQLLSAVAPESPKVELSSYPPPLHILSRLGTSHVACLRLFPGIKPVMLDAVLRVPNLRGLIIQMFGSGNAPVEASDAGKEGDGGILRVLREAKERENVVIGVSQCLTGSVSLAYAPARALRAAGVVPGADMTTEAALTKLAFLMAGGDEGEGGEEEEHKDDAWEESKEAWGARIDRVRELMLVSLRGELTV